MIPRLFDILFGSADTKPGIADVERVDKECTVCETTFDTARTTCPKCDSQIYRRKTTTPNALFTMLFVMALAGLEVAYNVLSGQYPKQGPGA